MYRESEAYHAIGDYLTEHFGSDALVEEAMTALAAHSLVHEVAGIALCRRWPNSPVIVAAARQLASYKDRSDAFTAWLFATKGSAEEVAHYVMEYPRKYGADSLGLPYKGVLALKERLRTDAVCREELFERLKAETDAAITATVARIIGSAMHRDVAFDQWVSVQLIESRKEASGLAPIVFDSLSYEDRPLEFCLLEASLTR
jgi:hypothetical protein